MLKKIILIIIVNSLIFPLGLFFKTPQTQGLSLITDELTNLRAFTSITQGVASAADAQRATSVPTFDTPQYSQLRSVETAKEAKQTKSNILQALFSMFLEMLKKRLLDSLVDQIIVWIQGGGKPQFVSDWKGFLEDAGQAAVGDVVLQTDAAFLCSPFKLQVQLALLPVPKFSEQVRCTLDDIVENIEDFYNNFSKGGWIAYSAMLEPQNNYFGTVLLAQNEIALRVAESQRAAENEARAGKGFLSVEKCASDGAGGEKCYITTPGNIVGEMISKGVGSDLDYILNAKDLEQYATAIVNAVINRVITEGLSNITGSVAGDDDLPSGYDDTITWINEQEKARIIAEYQEVIDKLNLVLSTKQQTVAVLGPALEGVADLYWKLDWYQPDDRGIFCNKDGIYYNVPVGYCVNATKFAFQAKDLEEEANNFKIHIEEVIPEIEVFISSSTAVSIESDAEPPNMETLRALYDQFNQDYKSVIAEAFSGEQISKEELRQATERRDSLKKLLGTCKGGWYTHEADGPCYNQGFCRRDNYTYGLCGL